MRSREKAPARCESTRVGYHLAMNEIIVAYDGSTESDRALVRAAEVAEALTTRLLVVSVTQPIPHAVPALEPAPPGPILVPGATSAIGIREHGFFARLFSAPVDEEVARHADRDVLLVH